MKFRAGFHGVVSFCVVILMPSLDSASKKQAASVPCRPKQLTAFTKHLVDVSLTNFDRANGKHLGTWQPGFPELQVQKDSPVNGSKVQCCLLFMAHGLEKVLDDQKRNLNPSDETLHENLRQAIFMNNMLSICMKELIGGECSPAPSPPKMPKHVFERKQWSHTLLKTGRDYLGWLELKVGLRLIRVRGKSKLYKKYLKAKNKKYMKGSRYLL